jgi:hypothetical protein
MMMILRSRTPRPREDIYMELSLQGFKDWLRGVPPDLRFIEETLTLSCPVAKYVHAVSGENWNVGYFSLFRGSVLDGTFQEEPLPRELYPVVMTFTGGVERYLPRDQVINKLKVQGLW